MNISIPQYNNGAPPRSITLFFPDGSSQPVELEKQWGTHRLTIIPVETNSLEREIGDLYLSKREKAQGRQYIQFAEIEVFGF